MKTWIVLGVIAGFSGLAYAGGLSDLDPSDLAPLEQVQQGSASDPSRPPEKESDNPLLRGGRGLGSDAYIDELELQGVATSAGDKAALVSNQFVTVGSEIAGYQVISIERGQVVLRNNNEEVTLRLNPVAQKSANAPNSYDIAFQNTEIKAALRFLASVGRFNLIVPEDIGGTVTVSFQGVSVEDAVVSILKVNGLDYASENGVLRIGKGDLFVGTGEDLKTESFSLRYATASELREQAVGLLSGRGSSISDDRTNTLIVKDISANLDQVRRLVSEVDVQDQQVLIEAKIIEASRDFSRDLGVQWGVNSDGTNDFDVSGLTPVGTSQGQNPLSQNLGFPAPTSGIGLTLGRLAGGTSIELQLQAAEQRGKARIISSPSIVTTNGQAAHIRSGQTLLIRTNSGVVISTGGTTTTPTTGTNSGTSNIQEIETGIELNVTPQISLNQHIKMVIEAITSQADFSRQIDGIPVISDNHATTTVLIKDRETTVIGGLVQNNTSTTRRGVPYLSRVPLFGTLFKSKSKRTNDAELLIFIKPTVLGSSRAEVAEGSPVYPPAVLEPAALKQSVDGQAAEEAEAAKGARKTKVRRTSPYKK